MSARARFRAAAKKQWTRKDKQRAALFAGVLIAAFLIGFGVTALSFSAGVGVEVTTVPDVRDMTVAQATRAMEANGLTLAVGDTFPNRSTRAGAILAQSPLPGQEVSPGSEVQVFVSTGAPRPTVPSIEGMPLALATRALQTAGFDVLVEEAPGQQRGEVLGTDPPSGSAVQLPATVRVQVSTGPPRLEMPTVIGMLEDQARSIIEDAGLDITETVYETTQFGEPGSVISQEPAPGDSVQVGTNVRLRVANPAPPTTHREERRPRTRRQQFGG